MADVATVVVEKLPASEPASARVMRFGLGDFQELGEWLLWRLKDRYPQVNASTLSGWLRGEMVNNEVMFIRLGNAVGMASIGHKSLLDPRPVIEEIFVLVKGRDADAVIEKAHLAEGARLYEEFKRWGETLGASELLVERMSDVPRDMIKAALGRVFAREVVFTKLGKQEK